MKGNRRTITRLEFGGRMTSHEAEYDTLITALETLTHQETPGTIMLDIQSSSQLVINQVKGTWEARNHRMQIRRDRVCELLKQFRAFNLSRISRERAMKALSH